MSYFFVSRNKEMDWRLNPDDLSDPEMSEAFVNFQKEEMDFLDAFERQFHPTFGLLGVFVYKQCECGQCEPFRDPDDADTQFYFANIYFVMECKCCGTLSPGTFTRDLGGIHHPENPSDAYNRMILYMVMASHDQMRLFLSVLMGGGGIHSTLFNATRQVVNTKRVWYN